MWSSSLSVWLHVWPGATATKYLVEKRRKDHKRGNSSMGSSFMERSKTISKTAKRSICVWLAVIPLFLSGCGLGPSMMRANRLTYNDAVQVTERQELLLNIVRLRYNEAPEFLATSSISTQFSLDLSAAAGAQVGHDQEQRTNLLNIGSTVGYSERPTITFTPRNEKEFTQQLISPIELDIIFLLVNYLKAGSDQVKLRYSVRKGWKAGPLLGLRTAFLGLKPSL